jgi:two-component system LytT family sensor kinase
MRRIGTTVSVVLTINVVAYVVRWASGQFAMEFNNILFVAGLVLLTIAWEGLRLINMYLDKVFPFERSIPARIALQLLLGTVLAVFVRFLIYKFGEQYLAFRLDNLFRAATWILYAMGMAGINSIFFTRYFMDRWKDSHVMAERLEKEKAQVQFDNLKNQLNPHFLFNALTSLNSLISESPALASQFLQHMSKVYRYVLQNKDKNFVTLRTEFEFIQNYVFLATTRFGEGLVIKFNIADHLWDKAIVPVTLQILIENALKHNIVDEQRPLTIEIFTTGDFLTVSNTLQPRKIVESSNKQGLDNLKSLYRYLSDNPVEVLQDENRFAVKIPLL